MRKPAIDAVPPHIILSYFMTKGKGMTRLCPCPEKDILYHFRGMRLCFFCTPLRLWQRIAAGGLLHSAGQFRQYPIQFSLPRKEIHVPHVVIFQLIMQGFGTGELLQRPLHHQLVGVAIVALFLL